MTIRQSKVTANIDGLSDFVKKIGGDRITRVGVLGDGGERDSISSGNAEIGAVHEFGSISGNIPQRSFLRMPLELKSKEFMKAMSSGAVKDAIAKGDYEAVYELMGVKAEQIIQDAFATGGFGQWPPLSRETVARKGSSEILKETNQLRRAVTSDVVNRSEVR